MVICDRDYIIWYGPYAGKDVRELAKDEKSRLYIQNQWGMLGECPLKWAIKEAIKCTSDSCQS